MKIVIQGETLRQARDAVEEIYNKVQHIWNRRNNDVGHIHIRSDLLDLDIYGMSKTGNELRGFRCDLLLEVADMPYYSRLLNSAKERV